MGWLSKLFNLDTATKAAETRAQSQEAASKKDACNRLKLVLMHDRTKLSPDVLEKMRDELVHVISKYVDIDREALELNLESESDTIALVANIPVKSTRRSMSVLNAMDDDDENDPLIDSVIDDVEREDEAVLKDNSA